MQTEYAGVVILEVDGKDIEVTSLNVTDQTGRRPVRTMNRTGRVNGFSRGLGQYDISLTAVIPADGSAIDWGNIERAKLTIEPLQGGKRTSYLDCFATQAGEAYSVDGEARVDVQLTALRKVIE